jgi:hypothetical protein
MLGERESGTARLEEAAAYRDALKERTREPGGTSVCDIPPEPRSPGGSHAPAAPQWCGGAGLGSADLGGGLRGNLSLADGGA